MLHYETMFTKTLARAIAPVVIAASFAVVGEAAAFADTSTHAPTGTAEGASPPDLTWTNESYADGDGLHLTFDLPAGYHLSVTQPTDGANALDLVDSTGQVINSVPSTLPNPDHPIADGLWSVDSRNSASLLYPTPRNLVSDFFTKTVPKIAKKIGKGLLCGASLFVAILPAAKAGKAIKALGGINKTVSLLRGAGTIGDFTKIAAGSAAEILGIPGVVNNCFKGW